MEITIDEKIEAMEEYLRCFPDDDELHEKLEEHKVAKALNTDPDNIFLWDNGNNIFRIDGTELRVAKQMFDMKLPNRGGYYVYFYCPSKGRALWRVKDINIDFYYELIVTELMKYDPIKVDSRETKFVYNLENGKKLLKDYENIMDNLEKKIYGDIVTIEEKEEFELYKRLKEKYEGENVDKHN